MPVQFSLGLIKFSVHKNDHNPPHVHVSRRGAKLIVDLRDISLLEAPVGFKGKEIRMILAIVEERREELLEAWRTYHE